MVRAAIITVVLSGLHFLYFRYVASAVPDYMALVVNFVVLPLLIGVIAFRAFRKVPKSLLLLLLAPALIPLPSVLYFGGDPAKPGLEWALYYVLVFFLALGEVAGCAAQWLLNRRKGAHVQA
jgi:hypothetical protein